MKNLHFDLSSCWVLRTKYKVIGAPLVFSRVVSLAHRLSYYEYMGICPALVVRVTPDGSLFWITWPDTNTDGSFFGCCILRF